MFCCHHKTEKYQMNSEASQLQDNSDWMGNLPVALHSKPLTNLSIPGSHDSFTYYLDKAGPIAPDTPDAIKNIGKIFGSLVKDFIYNWSRCQSLDGSDQLKAGVRYFDIRIAVRQDNGKLCICHGLYGNDIDIIFAQLLYFLEEHPKEIIFLDFNHFYDMTDATHDELIDQISQYLGHKLCPVQSTGDLTLDKMWDNNWQVLICYHCPDKVKTHPELWPGAAIASPWPNMFSVDKLLTTLETEYQNTRPGADAFFVFQGVLSPDTNYVLTHITETIKKCLCDKISTPFVKWVGEKSAGPKGISLCILDYIEEANYVNTVIGLNNTYAESLKA